jgi:hypothetical protein
VSSLRLPLEEPLSPELVLVCPELGDVARRLLPEPGWVAAAVKPEKPARPSPLETLVLAIVCALLTVTPLVLTLFLVGPRPTHH